MNIMDDQNRLRPAGDRILLAEKRRLLSAFAPS